nr:hypothetical protein [Synechococcus sp. CS-1327]
MAAGEGEAGKGAGPDRQQPANLSGGQVATHECDVPAQWVVMPAIMKIRIVATPWIAVMAKVIGVAEAIGDGGIEPQANLAQKGVQTWTPWNQAAMHGVVGHDEQASLQKGADQDDRCHCNPGLKRTLPKNGEGIKPAEWHKAG